MRVFQLVIVGANYFRIWEVLFQEKQIKESHTQLVPLKIEKENKFLDQIWIQQANQGNHLLIVLAAGNHLLLLQNDQLKKVIDIDVANLNVIEAHVHDSK